MGYTITRLTTKVLVEYSGTASYTRAIDPCYNLYASDTDIDLINVGQNDKNSLASASFKWNDIDSATDVNGTELAPFASRSECIAILSNNVFNCSAGASVAPFANKYMLWTGNYDELPGTREEDDVSEQDGWLMIANKQTDDRPAPVALGSADWTVLNQTFLNTTDTSIIYSGGVYTFTANTYIKNVRVWAITTDPNVKYSVIVLDETDPANLKIKVIEDPILNNGDWTLIPIGNTLIRNGSVIRVILTAENSNSVTTITGSWTYGGLINGTATALSQYVNSNVKQELLRISKTDFNSVDRTTDLLSVSLNTTIRVSQTSNLDNFYEYTVVQNPQNNPLDVHYAVSLTDFGGDIPLDELVTIEITEPISLATPYVYADNYWPTNQPNWATVEGFLLFDGVDQPGNDLRAFGADIFVQEIEISPDWDFLAFSGGIFGDISGTPVALNDVSWEKIKIASPSDNPQLNSYVSDVGRSGDFDDLNIIGPKAPGNIIFDTGSGYIEKALVISDVGGLESELLAKADKIIPAQPNNLAALDGTGNLADSGISTSDNALKFGNNYQEYVLGGVPFNVTSIPAIDIASFVTPSLPIGTYRISVTYRYGINALVAGFSSALLVDAAVQNDTVLLTYVPNTSAIEFVSYHRDITFNSVSTHTITLQGAKVGGGGGQFPTVVSCKLSIYRVA